MVQGRAPPDSEEAVGESQRRREDELDEEVTWCDDTQPVTEENCSEHECLEDVEDVALVTTEVELTASSVDGCQEITSDRAAVVNFILSPDDITPSESEADRADVSGVSLDLTAELHVSDEGTPAETDCHIHEDDDDEDTHPSACCSEMLLGFDSDAGSEGPFVNGHPVFDMRVLIADSSCVQTPAEPIGWHFPTGVGLSDVYFCPYVQFPAVSYYPVFQDSNNIEGGIIRKE